MTANLPAVPDDGGLAITYDHTPYVDEAAFSGTVRVLPADEVANQQVYRTLHVMYDLAARRRPDTEIIRRGAAVLLHDTVTSPGTPVRCPNCDRVFTMNLSDENDWPAAGSEHMLCIPCALKAPRHARPSKRKRDALGRSHGPDGRYLPGGA